MGAATKLEALTGFGAAMALVSAAVMAWARRHPAPSREASARRFLAIAATATLLVTAALWLAARRGNDGHFAYVIDDAAIHLSMGRQLVHHGTWGVSPGRYSSASSSPGWTLLLAGATALLPSHAHVIPLLLNVAAGLLVLWLLAHHQDFLLPRPGAPESLVLAAVAPVVLWFLPGLAIVGMEHSLHAALVLVALVALIRLQDRPLRPRTCWPLLAAVFLAALVRYETAFVAVGIAVALVAAAVPGLAPQEAERRWAFRPAAFLGAATAAAAALPLVTYGLVNRAFGDGFLPNSLLAKRLLNHAARGENWLPAPQQWLQALSSDPMVLAIVLLLTAYLFRAWFGGPRRNVAPAVTMLVTCGLHAAFSDVHYYERYQAYLVIGGSFVLLRIASEVVKPEGARAVLACSVVAVMLLSAVRINLTFLGPLASSNTYRQRYQLGLFLHDSYRGRTVATGELGYATYFHDGPVVDLLGLGTHEVLEMSEKGPLPADYTRDLVRRNHVAVIGMYAATRDRLAVPADWVLVGEWTLEEPPVTAFDTLLQFYAPDASLVPELDRKLRGFDARLPSRVQVVHHPLPG